MIFVEICSGEKEYILSMSERENLPEVVCKRCGMSFSGEACPSCGLEAKAREIPCPTCGTFTVERACPKCGQPLRGWKYRKAVAATRDVYGRPYENYGGKAARKKNNAETIAILIASVVLSQFGTLWIAAFRRRVPAFVQLLIGIAAFLMGVVAIVLQFSMEYGGVEEDRFVLNIVTALILYLLPAIIMLVRGIRGMRRR